MGNQSACSFDCETILGHMAIAKKCGFWALLAGLFISSAAHGDMGISPLRQVLSAENPVAEFVVSNPSDSIMHGRVSWIDLSATETGYKPASADLRSQLSAAPYLVVSPAQFRLKPGARMKVTVRIKDGTNIPKGERRSHLLIETEASRTPIRKASNSGMQVDVGLGMSAPVILRNGGQAKAKISGVKLLRDKEGLLMLEAAITPAGEQSTFGRLVATFKPNNNTDDEQVLGIRENVAGFTDAAQRKTTIPFGFLSLSAGELSVRYEGAEEFAGRVFDERSYDVAPPQKDD